MSLASGVGSHPGDDQHAFDEAVRLVLGLLTDDVAYLPEVPGRGAHADMVGRWMERNVTDMPAFPNPGTGGELVVGISHGTLPFAAMKDG